MKKHNRRELLGLTTVGLAVACYGDSGGLVQSAEEGAEATSQRSKVEIAISLLRKYHSCCTAVFAAYAPELGVKELFAARLTQAMPGIGCSGNVCGTVSGAALIIGLKTTNKDNIDDWESHQTTCEMIREFIDKFENIYQSTQCRDILGHDINSREKFKNAVEKGYFEQCPKVIENAVNILDEVLKSQRTQ